MSPTDLDALCSFLRRNAPGKPTMSHADPPDRAAGLRLTWYGRLGAPIATLTARPRSGRVVAWWQEGKTDDPGRAEAVAGFLGRLATFAGQVEAEMRRLGDAETTLSTTEARR